MRVKDLNGRSYQWQLGKYVGNINHNASALHQRCREFLRDRFPASQVLEEVTIPGLNLYLDFYIPTMKIAIETNGHQHDKFVPFFHNNNKKNFTKGQNNDKMKKEWCDINGITLIYFFPGEQDIQWAKKLQI